MNLLNRVKVTQVADPSTAGTAAVNSTAVDMQGYDGVLFLSGFGTGAANNTMNAAQGAASNGSDAADLEGTSIGDTANNELIALDVYKPADRYVRAELARGTSSTAQAIIAIQYGGRVLPPDNNVDDEITSEIHISPDEGTA